MLISRSRELGRRLRPALLTVGPLLAVGVEFMAMVLLGSQWADNYDVWSAGAGGCGWDGTCSQAGELTVTVGGLGVLLGGEFVIGMATGYRAWRRARLAGDTEGIAAACWASRLSVTVMLGCAATLAVLIQSIVIDAVAGHRFGTSISRQAALARFDFTWSTSLPVIEVVVGLLVWLAMRRRRHGLGPAS